jgi:hypothetical protein
MAKAVIFASGFRHGFRSFAEAVALVINSALLSLVYIVAVGGTSLAAKAAKKRFLDIAPEKRESYWEELDLGRRKKEEYYSQF